MIVSCRRSRLRQHLTEIAAPLTNFHEGAILASELARQGVDLRLPLRRQGGKARAIAFQKRLRVRRFGAAMARRLRLELRDQFSHASLYLPVDLDEMALNLSLSLFRAVKPPFALSKIGVHDAVLH